MRRIWSVCAVLGVFACGVVIGWYGRERGGFVPPPLWSIEDDADAGRYQLRIDGGAVVRFDQQTGALDVLLPADDPRNAIGRPYWVRVGD